MASFSKYITEREGNFQYHRRVPKSVIDRPLDFQNFFKSNKLFRKSLGTKSRAEMYVAAARVHSDFEDRVARALGLRHAAKTVPTGKRLATADDLADIQERFCYATARPFEQAHSMADCGEAHAAELERMIYDHELRAEEVKASLSPIAQGDTNRPIDAAKALIQREELDAPEGTKEFAAIVAAVRAGMTEGYHRIDALNGGAVIPTTERSATKAKAPPAPYLRDVATQYIAVKKPTPKTLSEMRLALSTFEGVVGNRRLGSGLTDQSQKMTVAASAIAEKKVVGQRS